MEYNELLIDLINIFPTNLDCYIQAPSLDNDVILNMLQKTELEYFKLLKLSNSEIEKVKEQEKLTNFSIYIQKIEIKHNDNLIFEGFDGVEFGILSNKLKIPLWFSEKYIPDACSIAENW